MLATRGLSKTYARGGWWRRGGDVVVAAIDVTLSIRRGETLGIVGESGSGKSTVARCIARLIEPSAGVIALDGVDIATLGGGDAAPDATARADRLPGPLPFAQSAAHCRRGDHRRSDELRRERARRRWSTRAR